MKNGKNIQKRILAVNDISCFGKCSVTVVMPVLAAMGFECVPLPTAVLSTHTGGFKNYTFLDMTSEIKKILAHWESENIKFDCIFTGYLGNEKQIDICSEEIDKRKKECRLILVDPVMADSGKLYAGFDRDYTEKMKKLCRKADIITPNYTEACFLAGMEYSEIPSPAEVSKCFEKLGNEGIKSAVITGIREKNGTIKTAFTDFSTGKRTDVSNDYIDASLHGGGDVFAAVLCGKILDGKTPDNAVRSAAAFTCDCIKITETAGQYGLTFEPLLSELKNY